MKTWVVTVDENGEIELPEDLLEQMGWGPGTLIGYRANEDSSIELEKVQAAGRGVSGSRAVGVRASRSLAQSVRARRRAQAER